MLLLAAAVAAGVTAVRLGAAQDPPSAPRGGAQVTFTRDVLPILQKNCQACHRPGEIGPMSFLTYETTRPWARAIKAAAASKKMPPWFADPEHGQFANDRSLVPADVATLVAWADGGAQQGDPRDAPPPVSWPDGWQVTPDHIVSAPPYTVPASGTIEWGYVTVPSGLTRDTWVTSIEVRPGVRDAIHHVVVFIKPHAPEVPYGVPLWDQKQRDAKGAAPGQPFLSAMAAGPAGERISLLSVLGTGGIEAVYVPGVPPQDYGLHRAAKLIPANSDIVFQVHYQPTGKDVTEVTQIGFTIAKEPPARRFITYSVQPPSIQDPKVFRIPAGAPNWESPPVEGSFNVDAELVWMMPHMHFRGKDMTYRLTYPDGRSDIVLRVPRYDFNWQIGYDVRTPIRVARGTRLRVDAHFDNSPANRANPDATVDVFGGTQSWEEMMNPFFGIVVDRDADPAKIMTLQPSSRTGG
jgi:hypothetical protein